MRVYSPVKLEAIDRHQRPDGFADVRLRRNIEKVTREPVEPAGDVEVMWVADEVYVVSTLGLDEIAEQFDAVWARAEREAMTTEERLSCMEQSSDDQLQGLGELGEGMYANQQAIADCMQAVGELGAIMAGGEQQW